MIFFYAQHNFYDIRKYRMLFEGFCFQVIKLGNKTRFLSRAVFAVMNLSGVREGRAICERSFIN